MNSTRMICEVFVAKLTVSSVHTCRLIFVKNCTHQSKTKVIFLYYRLNAFDNAYYLHEL